MEEINILDDSVHEKPEVFSSFNPSIDIVEGSDGVQINDIRSEAVEDLSSSLREISGFFIIWS